MKSIFPKFLFQIHKNILMTDMAQRKITNHYLSADRS